MGRIAVLFRVYAAEGKEESVKASIETLKPKSIGLEDVAFGIKVIKVLFITEDAEGTSSALEEKLRRTKDVNEVEILEETLIS